jgi:aldehyde:ferredoxin oxidoreductase
MARSFHNKILRVNLTDGSIKTEEPGASYFRRYMGGWNIIADVLLKEVPQGADALGPQNKLIFAPGVLTGLPISGASRVAVGAKSPLTGGFGAAEMGGFFGADIKRVGYDAIIIEGAAKTPKYLWINAEGAVEIRDASKVWGLKTKEAIEGIQEELGDKRIHCGIIGPGGENLVRYACVMDGLKDAAGRTGLGAVMGSKKLKAIAIRATTILDGENPEVIKELAQFGAKEVREGRRAGMSKAGTGGTELNGMILQGNMPIRNFRDGEFPEITGLEYTCDKIGIGMEGCYACAVRCKKVVKAETANYKVDPAYGGPEYETIGSLGSCCGVSDIVAVSRGNELCNAHTLDTIGAGVMIGFAMECYENGLITKKDTGGIDLRFGNGDAMIAMVEKIALRQDIGDALAEGHAAAVAKIGKGAEMFVQASKNQAYPMHEPRFKRGLAIGYSVSPTGADHCHSLHDTGLAAADANGWNGNGRMRGMGQFMAMPLEDLGPDKVRATMYNSIGSVEINCLGMCSFPGWTQDELASMVNAATGWDVTSYEMLKAGERALTLARAFNMREGLTAADDDLSPRSFGPTNGGTLAEGGLDREELHAAMQTWYGMMGWDPETGIPTLGKLMELDVAWAAAYLPKK